MSTATDQTEGRDVPFHSNIRRAAKRFEFGLVKQVDTAHRRIKLSNGKWYMVPRSTDLKSLRIGENVEVAYDLTHHHYYASSIRTVQTGPRPADT